jgi:quercetin dioxygenase-like cupin family protein
MRPESADARRAVTLTLTLALLLAGPGVARQPAPIDAATASPDRFKVLLENQHVRVLEYVLLPGERDQWHTHPPKVSYVVSGGTLRITTDSGQSFLSDEKTGSASWMDSLGKHFAENVGTAPVRIVLVEIKDVS